LIVAILLVGVAGISLSAEGLTDAQLKSWWNSLSTSEQLGQLRLLDTVEHAVPEIPSPRYVAILKGRDLILDPYYENGAGFDVAKLGPWAYHVKWKERTIKDWAPKPKIRAGTYVVVAAISLLVGGATYAVLTK